MPRTLRLLAAAGLSLLLASCASAPARPPHAGDRQPPAAASPTTGAHAVAPVYGITVPQSTATPATTPSTGPSPSASPSASPTPAPAPQQQSGPSSADPVQAPAQQHPAPTTHHHGHRHSHHGADPGSGGGGAVNVPAPAHAPWACDQLAGYGGLPGNLDAACHHIYG